ncbi:hypothetical protein N9N67_07530 [Bacteriovoracaceae bacterium]|nr:hypothetical protein [Bacteriovoracaceae bacterium]
MEDLISLQASRDYIEILDHIFDIPPKNRSVAWKTMLQESALAVTEQLNSSLTYPQELYNKIYRLTSRPYLKTNQIFYDAFLRLSLREAVSCFEEKTKIKQSQCLLAPFELLKTYVDQEHFTKFYQLFNRYSNEQSGHYESLLNIFVTTLLPRVKFNSPHHLCSTEKIKSIYYTSIINKKRPLIPEGCFKIMQTFLISKSIELNVEDRLEFLTLFRKSTPIKLLSRFKYLSYYQSFTRDLMAKNYKNIHVELLKLKSNPNLRDQLIGYLKKETDFHSMTISASFKKPLFRDLNQSFPELISWYYRICKRNDTSPLGEEFCQNFNSMNQKEQFI